MSKTKIFWSAVLAIVLVLCVGLNGAGMAEAQSASAVQIAMSAGDLTGRLLGICIFPLYLLTIVLPLIDIIFEITYPFVSSYDIPEPLGVSIERLMKQFIAPISFICFDGIGNIWNLLVIFVFYTCYSTLWLFDLVPLVGWIYEKSIIKGIILPIISGLLVEG
jgi:hypothetical protein